MSTAKRPWRDTDQSYFMRDNESNTLLAFLFSENPVATQHPSRQILRFTRSRTLS